MKNLFRKSENCHIGLKGDNYRFRGLGLQKKHGNNGNCKKKTVAFGKEKVLVIGRVSTSKTDSETGKFTISIWLIYILRQMLPWIPSLDPFPG